MVRGPLEARSPGSSAAMCFARLGGGRAVGRDVAVSCAAPGFRWSCFGARARDQHSALAPTPEAFRGPSALARGLFPWERLALNVLWWSSCNRRHVRPCLGCCRAWIGEPPPRSPPGELDGKRWCLRCRRERCRRGRGRGRRRSRGCSSRGRRRQDVYRESGDSNRKQMRMLRVRVHGEDSPRSAARSERALFSWT